MSEFIEPIFNLFKVKFDKMDELGVILKGTETVNFYINLKNVFSLLLQPRIDNQLRASGTDFKQMKVEFISCIINLGQHYRLYACSHGRKLNSKIFLYWNYPRAHYKNRAYIGTYRNEYDGKMFRNIGCSFMTEVLADALDLLKTTTEYINEVYLIDGGVAESSLVPFILWKELEKTGEITQHVIVSKSVYDYQYLGINEFTNLIPARDESFILNGENVIEHMKTVANSKNTLSIPSGQIGTLLSLLGDTHRTIPKIDGYGLIGGIKLINNAIEKLVIGDDTKSIEILSQIIEKPKRGNFERNFRCVNFESQYADLTPTEIHGIMSQIIDRCQDEKLKEINDTIFKLCPLMTINTRTEQIRKSERFRYDVTSIFR